MRSFWAFVIAWAALLPVRAQDVVGPLREALGNNDHDAVAAQKAVDAAVAAGAAEALPVLLTALDRYGELLSKSEVEGARARVALENVGSGADDSSAAGDAAKADPAKAEQAKKDQQAAIERAAASGSSQQRVLDVVARGIPALLDALAAAPKSAAVPTLLSVYEESSRRLQELERSEEKLKGDLAQRSSRLYTLEQQKN